MAQSRSIAVGEASRSPLIKPLRAKPMLPVIHNAKAFNIAPTRQGTLQDSNVRTISHRGHNPHFSQFHMQARLGFQRRKQHANVRLRPLGDPVIASPPFVLHRHRKKRVAEKAALASKPDRFGSNVTSSFYDSRPMTALTPSEEEHHYFTQVTSDTMNTVILEAFEEEDLCTAGTIAQNTDDEPACIEVDPAPLLRPSVDHRQKSQSIRNPAVKTEVASVEAAAVQVTHGSVWRQSEVARVGSGRRAPSVELFVERSNTGCCASGHVPSECCAPRETEVAVAPLGPPPSNRPHRRVLQVRSNEHADGSVMPATLSVSKSPVSSPACLANSTLTGGSVDVSAGSWGTDSLVPLQRRFLALPSVGTWMSPISVKRCHAGG
eukprot:TRINITY_DN8898_c0_g1_i1.p1 TRINITY_DN8898_c0_g1~~TRINITY_DN8898_c0_g1_i1.p1  ORF type:complete len:397 (+),score=39.05 TRINITY_DN8898_c0_g1_i1:59-1192(+)